MAVQEFIEKIKGIADKVYQQTGVLPSVTIAQGIQETGGSVNNLLAKGYNFFGEKGTGDAGSVRVKTQEDYGDGLVNIMDNFRVYSGEDAAATGRAKIMQQSNFQAVGKATDFNTQTKLLKAGGYATDPNYVSDLQNLYKEYNLAQYDTGVSAGTASNVESDSPGSSTSITPQKVSWWSQSIPGFMGKQVIYGVLISIGIVALFFMVAPEKSMQLISDTGKKVGKAVIASKLPAKGGK